MIKKIVYKVSQVKDLIFNKYLEFKFNSYRRRALISLDPTWFKDKRVAIVGGASSAFEEKLGSYIDQYDIVVRVNKGVEVITKHEEYVGKKTDILFHCLYENVDYGGSPITLELWREHAVKKLVFSSNLEHAIYGGLLKKFLWKTKGRVPVVQLDPEHVKDVYECIEPFYPTTGFIAIHSILGCKPKELYLTGITFFKTPHFDGYRNESLDSWNNIFSDQTKSKHNPHVEYLYVKKVFEQNPNIIVPDKTLKQIFLTN